MLYPLSYGDLPNLFTSLGLFFCRHSPAQFILWTCAMLVVPTQPSIVNPAISVPPSAAVGHTLPPPREDCIALAPPRIASVTLITPPNGVACAPGKLAWSSQCESGPSKP